MGLPEAAGGEVTGVREVRRVLTSSSRISAGVWGRESMEVNVKVRSSVTTQAGDKRLVDTK